VPWGVDRIGADSVWTFNTGQGIKVAVVDSGIDSDHPDLASNLLGGINAGNEDLPPEDDYGHGTMVAGVIAAVNNSEGVIGVGPGIGIYSVKINFTGMSAIYRGIEWCVYGNDGTPGTGDEPNVQVINMSFGIETELGVPVDDEGFHTALQTAYGAGIVLVAAAGNDAADLGVKPHYPACYDEVITVSATGTQTVRGKRGTKTQVDYFASWSNYGDKVDLAAPGVSVETTMMGGGYYGGFSGTSASCPHVVGAAALVLKSLGKTKPEAGCPELVRTKLKEKAELLDSLTLQQQGAGLVDAENAVTGD